MMTNDLFSTVVESTDLGDDVDLLSSEVEGWINNGGQPKKNANFNLVNQQLKSSAKNKLNEAEFIELLKNFKKYLQSLPVLELTIAFQPDQEFRRELSKRLTTGTKEKFVIKILTDKKIIAGCIINCQGKLLDYSIARVFEENKASIFGEILKAS